MQWNGVLVPNVLETTTAFQFSFAFYLLLFFILNKIMTCPEAFIV